MKISVIVPIYNKKRFVEKCIKSILHWGKSGYEIILVDDGSKDGSSEILDGFGTYNNVVIIHQENKGVSSARNTGLQASKGEYVTFVDADDEVIEGSLDSVMPYLTGEDDICIAGAVSEGQSAEPLFTDTVFSGDDAKAAFNFILTGGTKEKRIPKKATVFMSGCKEKFYKRDFIESHDISFDTGLRRNEDLLWSYRCYFHAGQIHFLPATVYVMKGDPDGITNGMDIQNTVNSFIIFVQKFNAYFNDCIETQYLMNSYFHISTVISYEAYKAMKNKKIKLSQFHSIMKQWYAQDAIKRMKKRLKGSELSFFKRVAYYLMKANCYLLVGVEMDVHHRHRA